MLFANRIVGWPSAGVRAIFLLLLTQSPLFGQNRYVPWHHNLVNARRLSEKTGKPIFVVFRCER
ncbi:MAG: hypothetical protein IID45_01905 [Planctomycetes bacterium]|nr:hypothetical protein [Planctomycetota bacterium]